jgi:hypothetical protein
MPLYTDDLTTLRTEMAGEVFTAADSEWDAARLAWNLLADQRPAMVSIARDAADVAATVRYARASGLRVAPQTTGHGACSLEDLDDTILLRTGALTGVEIDPVARVARVGAGVLWREVVDAAAASGLVALHGSSPTVGVAGYTLGGGLSWLARREGMAAHHVRSFQVVTADGELQQVDAENEPDLFWALRGGGGGQAIVTAIEFELFPLSTVFAGSMLWPMAEAERILHGYREWVQGTPETVTSTAKLTRFPDLPMVPDPMRGRELIGVSLAFCGEEAEGHALVRPLLEIGTPYMQHLGMIPGAALADLAGDPAGPVPGLGDGLMIEDFSAAACDALLELAGPGVVTPLLGVQIRQLGGAVRRPPANAGAVGSLDGDVLVMGVGMCPVPPAAAAVRAALGAMRDRLAPHASDRCFLSFNEHDRRLAASFSGPVAARLRDVTRAYDPHGVIVANHRGC